jgi:GH15 family glucan-1,4-alpha-glucosidase
MPTKLYVGNLAYAVTQEDLEELFAQAGKVERAKEVYATAIAFVNDVGLLAEEVDGDSGELLGNFPQAFSHIGLVNAAWAITQAQQRTGRT